MNNVNQIDDQLNTIVWDNKRFLASRYVFIPKHSTIGMLHEVVDCLKYFDHEIPIIDLCCGTGAIGISSFINNSESFKEFYGFDNDVESIKMCKKNIQFHLVKGEAHLWEAGTKLPLLKKGLVVCNPPFLSKSELSIDTSSKESLVYSGNEGLDVLFKCFHSLMGTGHILILKSFKNQISIIKNKVGSDFLLLREVEYEIEKDYTIAFTTWKQK